MQKPKQVIQRFINSVNQILSRSENNGRGAHAQKGGQKRFRGLLMPATEAFTYLPLVK